MKCRSRHEDAWNAGVSRVPTVPGDSHPGQPLASVANAVHLGGGSRSPPLIVQCATLGRFELIDAPPFHMPGESDGHFYALAYVPGRYISPSGTADLRGFFALYWSPSKGFAPFSHMSISADDGSVLQYSRGSDAVRTVEFSILSAWQVEGVPADVWRLLPKSLVDAAVFPDAATRDDYWETRRRLCQVLYPARAREAVVKQVGRPSPLFRVDGPVPAMDDDSPDNAEIWETVVALTESAESPPAEEET